MNDIDKIMKFNTMDWYIKIFKLYEDASKIRYRRHKSHEEYLISIGCIEEAKIEHAIAFRYKMVGIIAAIKRGKIEIKRNQV